MHFIRRLIAIGGRHQNHIIPNISQRRVGASSFAASSFHSGLITRLADVVMNVPSMGDSITEGTIREWQKNVGDAIKIDEVVVVIETDKVSVDIRATSSGILAEQYADVDQTVEVGAKLLKIDTKAEPGSIKPAYSSQTASAPAPAAEEEEDDDEEDAAAAPSPSSSSTSSSSSSSSEEEESHHAHKPLIKFLGKRSLLGKEAAAPTPPATSKSASKSSPAPPVRYEDIKGTPGAKVFTDLPPMYGRPKFSKAEMEAIEMGGVGL